MSRAGVKLSHRIIAITGPMHGGKSTVIDYLSDRLSMSEYYPRLIKFAAPLYDIQNYIYDRCGLDKPKVKDRKLLQFIGTDWGRQISENVWVDAWRKAVRIYMLGNTPINRRVVLCDDCRFSNEAKQIKEMGGMIVEVTAPYEIRKARCNSLGCGCMEKAESSTHSSESGIDRQYIDYTIDNSGEPSDLRINLRAMLELGKL